MDKDFLDKKKRFKRIHHNKFGGVLIRKFTVMAAENCDLLALTLKDLLKMKLEFPEAFMEIANNAVKNLKSESLLKVSLTRLAEENK